MSNLYEKKINRSSIRASYLWAGSKVADSRNRKRRVSRRQASNRLYKFIRTHKRSYIPGSESGLGSTRSQGKEFRARVSGITETSSVHRQAVGESIQEKDGAKMMKILVVANQKGGVGKTSTLVHLAFDFYERGLKVVVIDLDTQGNASYTLQTFRSGFLSSELFADISSDYSINHTEFSGMTLIESDPVLANMEKMNLAEAGKNFRKAIKALEGQKYDVCLIDTAPSLGNTMAAALLSADYVLSPIELEAYSIQGIQKMVTTIGNIRKANPKLKFLGMVPSKVDGRNPRHGRHLAELNQAYPDFMIPTGIGLRSSIADALASCVPVWKIKKTSARKAVTEIRALAAHVFEKMEINNG